MKRDSRWILTVLVAAGMIVFGSAFSPASGQSADSQAAPKITAEQQKHLDQLKQLEEQLQKDREAMHSAVTQFGWDSEQVDEAQDKLFRDRSEYRKLRRSWRAAGIAVPPSSGMGAGPQGGREGRWGGRMHHRGQGCHHCADCPCCGE